MLNQLKISREWEESIIDWIIADIRNKNFVNEDTGILQLSAEYSGILAVNISHKLSLKGKPLPIEVIKIPLVSEFKLEISQDILDKYSRLIIADSGCMSGNNFKNVCNIFLNYGFKRESLLFVCCACNTDSIFKPDICPVYFPLKHLMLQFDWECKTNIWDSSTKFDQVEKSKLLPTEMIYVTNGKTTANGIKE